MAAYSQAYFDSGLSKLVILLLGERQSGKSSAGNTILGRRAFQISTETVHSSKETGWVCGKQVAVVDTPGWSSCHATPHSSARELCRGMALCQPELHAILLVVPTSSRFSQAEWETMEAHLRLLETTIWQRAMVLFTHGDKLGHLPIEMHIKSQGRMLRWLLERCGNRYHVMSSHQDTASGRQVQVMLQKIEKMVEANMRPTEVQQGMYALLREELRRKTEGRWQGGREDADMAVTHDGIPRQVRMASRPTVLPRDFLTGPQSALRAGLGLVLLGRRRSGKSSAGNLILDREAFHTDTKTVRCAVADGNVSRWTVTVVDTPGWSQFGLARPEHVQLEIGRSPSLCPPGSKLAFMLAIPVDSFKERDRRAVEKYLSVLGERVWRSTVLLFTYGGELRGRNIEKYIEQKGEALRWVLDRCGYRHLVLNQCTTDKTEVIQLLEIVEQMNG